MKPATLKNHYYVTLPVLLILLILSCHKNTKNVNCLVVPMALSRFPDVEFKVADKTTNQNFFFGSAAKYKLSQLKMAQIINGVSDSLTLYADSLQSSFAFNLRPAHIIDTVTMQVADLPQNILLFKTSTVNGPCYTSQNLEEIVYNGVSVYTAAKGPNVVTLTE